jgi:hypothetical protein
MKPVFCVTPPQAKTWSQRGRTPIVRVRGRSRRRISIAALTCCKPGHKSRLIYRPRRDGAGDGRKSFSWRDYRDLLTAAHQQLGAPIVLIWDNLNVHKAAGPREFADARDWLTIFLPPYALALNAVEGICRSCDAAGPPTSPSPPPTTSSRPPAATCGTSNTTATSSTAT